MATNELTIEQCSTLLNEIVKQATGKNPLTAISGADFVTVAQMGLKAGYDPLLNAIGQTLTKTIFSSRPYSRKLAGLMVSEQRWGNITRKIQIGDQDFQNDERYSLEDGTSVDMFAVKKPDVLQTNYYGSVTYEKQSPTIFKDQLDCAFSSAEEFGRFVSTIAQNVSDQIEQAHENIARATIVNLIAGRIAEHNSECVVHLKTEYAAVSGVASVDITKPENYPAFIKWVYGRVAGISSKMTERTSIYHTNITGHNIMRHTPLNKQKVYLYAPTMYDITARVIADTYHDNFLKFTDHENVNFWQSIKTPDEINTKPVYLEANGTLATAEMPLDQKNVFGVIFDEEAAGYTVVNQWSQATPFNARGGYSNLFFHFTERYWNDFTENAVVLLMD